MRNFLVANALYWLEEFHVDGIRVDAVASMIYLDYSREAGEWQPNVHGGRENLEAVDFLQELNGTVYKRVPGAITIAEESTSWPGVTETDRRRRARLRLQVEHGLDARLASSTSRKDPVHRSYHHHQLTFAMVYAYSENYVLPISHDEVVHGKGSLLRKMPGDRWQQLANVRAFLSWQWAHPGKQLLFMGQEFAQDHEWAEQRELDWGLLANPGHAGVQRLVADLNAVYVDSPALWSQDTAPDGFQWLERGRRRQQHRGVPALGLRRQRAGVRHQLLGESRTRATARAAVRRRVDRGDQHRRRGLRRLRGRQPRHRDRPRPARTTASPPRPPCACPRSARCGWPAHIGERARR